jgi:hypothetical protein
MLVYTIVKDVSLCSSNSIPLYQSFSPTMLEAFYCV